MVALSGTTSYGYDALYRLTQVIYPGPSTTNYTYDASGNRQTMQVGSTTTTYTYDAADEMNTAGAVTYLYDANGNQTKRGANTFTYDHENRLTKSVIGSTTSTSIYNGDGLRVSHKVGSKTTSYTWDVARGMPVLLQDGTNTYVYGLDLISSTKGTTQTYFVNDGLGSTANLTSSTGSTTVTYTYDAFGAIKSQTGSSTNYWLFTGEQRDSETSLYFLRARYYDPATGRFLAHDPLPTGNLYAYVSNNPVNSIDPTGLFCVLGACTEDVPLPPIPEPVRDWARDRVNDIAATATHVIQNPTNLLNYGVANEILGATISAFSSCDRKEKEGGIVIYEGCTGGLAHLISTLNGGKAFTVGSFIFSPHPLLPDLLRHELCHVRQYDHWGIAFLPAYFAVEPLPGTNPFESNADSCAGTHFYN